MSEEEQDRQHGELLVRERKLKKRLACLQSKAQQTYESLYIVLGAIRGCEIDFAYVKKNLSDNGRYRHRRIDLGD